MDSALAIELIQRDWAAFVAQSARLNLGTPTRTGADITIPVRPAGSTDEFLAVLVCDGYDAVAPLLDFADPSPPADPAARGGPFWPRMASAPMNQITYNGRRIPIICTPGTRGYHLHPSHQQEQHPRTTWRLATVATLLGRFLTQMGPYQGRGA